MCVCRELVLSYSDVLASPALDSFADITVVTAVRNTHTRKHVGELPVLEQETKVLQTFQTFPLVLLPELRCGRFWMFRSGSLFQILPPRVKHQVVVMVVQCVHVVVAPLCGLKQLRIVR